MPQPYAPGPSSQQQQRRPPGPGHYAPRPEAMRNQFPGGGRGPPFRGGMPPHQQPGSSSEGQYVRPPPQYAPNPRPHGAGGYFGPGRGGPQSYQSQGAHPGRDSSGYNAGPNGNQRPEQGRYGDPYHGR